MRTLLCAPLAALLLAAGGAGQAERPKPEEPPHFVLPLDALGGSERLAEVKGVRLEGKSRSPDGSSPPLTYTWTWYLVSKWRFDVHGKPLPEPTCFVVNGERGWFRLGEQTTTLTGQAVKDLIDQASWKGAAELTPLADRDFKLSVVGEARVAGRPATCVQATAKGWRDMKLYFDQQSRLLVKAELRGSLRFLPGKGAERVPNERMEFYFSNYRETDGLKHWRRLSVYVNGRLRENHEITSVRYLNQADEEPFRQP